MDHLSRRSFLGLPAAALPAAALLAGCGEDDGPEPDSEAELRALNRTLELELSAIAFYAGAGRLLTGDRLETAELFAEQEREHADALTEAIEGLGGNPARPRSDEAYRERLGLDELSGEDELLTLAVELESSAVAVYGASLAKLSAPELRSTVFEIVAVEAGHMSVLLGDLGEPQVPDAFVVGTQTRIRKP